MRIRLLTALVLAAAVPATSAASAQTPAAIGHPVRATDVVVRVSTGGGFVPVQVNLRALPSFTLYGDGSVIVPGPVIQIYPGPAIYPLVRSRLSERQVQALLRRAQAAGLLARAPIGYGDMGAVGVSDMPTTTLIVNARGRHVERSAYALGATRSGRLSPAQVTARRALAGFIAQLPQGLKGTFYAPHAIAVYAGPYQGQGQSGARRVRWPLASDLATAGRRPSNGFAYRCITVRGKAVATLLATLRKANEQSRWIARAGVARSYQVIAVPLLPDQRDCAALHR
jgi:hypothetical protein